MSTGTIWQIESSSSDDTFAIGERFGKRCKGGELFVLSSDLGGGKTTFTKGLAKGLGYDGSVSSPTFTVNKVYETNRGLSVHHFDFYRLQDPGLLTYELSEVIDDPKVVAVIEWADIVESYLPRHRVVIALERTNVSESHRRITIHCPEGMQYLGEVDA